MALSSNSRLRPAQPPAPPPSTPTPAAGAAGAETLSDADEIAKLLNALSDADAGAAADSPVKPAPPPPVKPAPPPAVIPPAGGKPSPSATRRIDEKPVDFVIPAGPGGATRPLGNAFPASSAAEPASDMDFILPDLKPETAPPPPPPPSPPVVKLAPVAAAPARTPTGAIRLGGAKTDAAKTGKHGTVRLTDNLTAAAKTGKHSTVRLTGNQTEAAKTAKHGTVRLTGNQSAAAAAADAQAATPPPLPKAEPEAIPELEDIGFAGEKGSAKPRKRTERGGMRDNIVNGIVLFLVILVILLYVGFFIVRPKFGDFWKGRAPAQPAPVATAPAKPSPAAPARKPVRKPLVPKTPAAKDGGAGKAAAPQVPAKSHKPDAPPDARPGGAAAVTAPNGLGEVDVPEDDEAPVVAAPEQPASKFAPPWERKAPQKEPEKPKVEEIVLEVPAAVDVPEVREWPELRVTAVIGSGTKGSVLVNGNVVSVGEELEEGPVLKAVSRQAAVFEWDGDRRTIFVSSKVE